MNRSARLAPPRVGVRVGETLHPAVPVALCGQAVALRVDPATWRKPTARLRLDWEDGRVTELDARLHTIDRQNSVAELEIYGVAGDWRPFVEYLGVAGRRQVDAN